MNFLSPLLLSLSLNLNTLTVGISYGIKRIRINRSSVILVAIITSFGTFISMCIGKIIEHFLNSDLSNIFGNVLLILIGIYFIIEFMRIEKKHHGEDTSYYVESTLKYEELLEGPNIIDIDKSGEIDIINSLVLSISLTINSLGAQIAASIAGVNISLSVLFNFIVTIISIYLGYFPYNSCFSKLFIKYAPLASGILLIVLGIYEIFI